MKRIGFIHVIFPAGGAERVTVDIAEYLTSIGGYEIFVYTAIIDEKLISPKINSLITIRKTPYEKEKRSAAIEQFIKDDNIDIVVQVVERIHDISGISERTGCKIVFANHGEPFWQRHSIISRRKHNLLTRFFWKLYLKRIYEKKGKALKLAIKRYADDYNTCDAYTVLCKAYKTETEKAYGIDPKDSHIYVIENSERAIKNVCLDKEKIILFSGRLECVSKRIDRLLRIWSKVQYELKDWKLVIVGDGPHRQLLEKLAATLKLERYSFEGKTYNMDEYYRRASIVCLVSQTEGWGLALTEAQAHGCIPVAFGCTSGVIDILSPNGINGFVVPPFNEDEYAKTLIKIANMEKAEQEKIRLSAINKRLQYTPDKIGKKYKDLFDTLLESSKTE